ncbi:unnamed protein product, partial [Urochloa humidicola]
RGKLSLMNNSKKQLDLILEIGEASTILGGKQDMLEGDSDGSSNPRSSSRGREQAGKNKLRSCYRRQQQTLILTSEMETSSVQGRPSVLFYPC